MDTSARLSVEQRAAPAAIFEAGIAAKLNWVNTGAGAIQYTGPNYLRQAVVESNSYSYGCANLWSYNGGHYI